MRLYILDNFRRFKVPEKHKKVCFFSRKRQFLHILAKINKIQKKILHQSFPPQFNKIF